MDQRIFRYFLTDVFSLTSELKEMPVSAKVIDELKNPQRGDTTGCGDNFVGGVIASVVNQL